MINQKLKDDEPAQLKRHADTSRDLQKDLKACDFQLLGCRDFNTTVINCDPLVFIHMHGPQFTFLFLNMRIWAHRLEAHTVQCLQYDPYLIYLLKAKVQRGQRDANSLLVSAATSLPGELLCQGLWQCRGSLPRMSPGRHSALSTAQHSLASKLSHALRQPGQHNFSVRCHSSFVSLALKEVLMCPCTMSNSSTVKTLLALQLHQHGNSTRNHPISQVCMEAQTSMLLRGGGPWPGELHTYSSAQAPGAGPSLPCCRVLSARQGCLLLTLRHGGQGGNVGKAHLSESMIPYLNLKML